MMNLWLLSASLYFLFALLFVATIRKFPRIRLVSVVVGLVVLSLAFDIEHGCDNARDQEGCEMAQLFSVFLNFCFIFVFVVASLAKRVIWLIRSL
jgi:hypothetical protein